jgi:hypothetical protein
MDSPLPIIIVWALMAMVIIAYVVYRLMTDRRSGGKRHALYPLASNPSDGMFPEKGDYLSWGGYGLLTIGLVGFIGLIFTETTDQAIPTILGNFTGITILIGLGLIGLAKHKQKGTK